ncbi:MAG: OB-fold nucleic acid binding domain-containing protein, partial [Thermomicrobiales bacterium]
LGRREALWHLGLIQPTRAFGGGRTTREPGRQLALPLDQNERAELRPMGPWEQMATDYSTMGMSPRYHPLGLLRPRLPAHFATTAALSTLPDGMKLTIAGLVVCRQRPGTANGITFLLLEDELGLLNAIVFPDLYEEHRHVVRGEPFLVLSGTLQRRNNTINLVVERLAPLDEARQRYQRPEDAPEARDIDVIAARASRTVPPGAASLRDLAPASHNYR